MRNCSAAEQMRSSYLLLRRRPSIWCILKRRSRSTACSSKHGYVSQHYFMKIPTHAMQREFPCPNAIAPRRSIIHSNTALLPITNFTRLLSHAHERNHPTYIPKLLLTPSLTVFSNSPLLSLHILAASMLAGLSSLGSASMLITLMRIFSTLCMGLQRSEAFS